MLKFPRISFNVKKLDRLDIQFILTKPSCIIAYENLSPGIGRYNDESQRLEYAKCFHKIKFNR